MLSLISQPDQKGNSPAEKLFGHKLRTTIPYHTQSTTTQKHTVTQNLRHKLSEITPGTTVRIRTDERNLWDKKGIVMSQDNFPQW